MTSRQSRTVAPWIAAAFVLLAAGCGGGGSSSAFLPLPPAGGGTTAPAAASLKVLSTRADMVSGGSALVEVVLPPSANRSSLKVSLGGTDVSGAFKPNGQGRILGLVSGLAIGTNKLTVAATDSSFAAAALVVTNHPAQGPVFSGVQSLPYVCATPAATPGDATTPATNASGLAGSATDAQCAIATQRRLFYRTLTPVSVAAGDGGCSFVLPDPSPPAPGTPAATPANSCFQPYEAASTPLVKVAKTRPDGLAESVPYIVQIERGTINRGIYDIAVLIDPTRAWNPADPQPQWSGKVVYSFGASTGQPRLQFRSSQNWADDAALSRGMMVVANGLTDSAYNANHVQHTETVMMMKEHIVDTYGEIKYTMGNGCSGGSIMQNTTASIYPGLLDGIQVQCDYSDTTTTATEVEDCVLLVNYYASPAWKALVAGLSPAQVNARKAAINGHQDQLGCHSWNNAFGPFFKPGNYVIQAVIDADGNMAPFGAPRNNCGLPAALVYDAKTNPAGVRCTDVDAAIPVWGTAPGTRRANLTYDNTGIQYGLKALRSAAITPEEFVVLNEKIGGLDADNERSPARSVADAAALPIAYRSGNVGSGLNFSKLPIIDARGRDETGIHHTWRSFSQRDRIDADAGGHGNQVIWRFGPGLAASASMTLDSFLGMDAWLSALNTSAPKAFVNDARTQQQVVAARPRSVFDFCYLSSDATQTTKVTDPAACDADPGLVLHGSPRQVAGGSRTENVLKCQLKPIAAADYAPSTLSDAQLGRLRTVFPDGVCDFAKPGVGQQQPAGLLDYSAVTGGVVLPAAPVSSPL